MARMSIFPALKKHCFLRDADDTYFQCEKSYEYVRHDDSDDDDDDDNHDEGLPSY
jgi:hypothetical protein